jgi:hypothetical protein
MAAGLLMPAGHVDLDEAGQVDARRLGATAWAGRSWSQATVRTLLTRGGHLMTKQSRNGIHTSYLVRYRWLSSDDLNPYAWIV